MWVPLTYGGGRRCDNQYSPLPHCSLFTSPYLRQAVPMLQKEGNGLKALWCVAQGRATEGSAALGVCTSLCSPQRGNGCITARHPTMWVATYLRRRSLRSLCRRLYNTGLSALLHPYEHGCIHPDGMRLEETCNRHCGRCPYAWLPLWPTYGRPCRDATARHPTMCVSPTYGGGRRCDNQYCSLFHCSLINLRQRLTTASDMVQKKATQKCVAFFESV